MAIGNPSIIENVFHCIWFGLILDKPLIKPHLPTFVCIWRGICGDFSLPSIAADPLTSVAQTQRSSPGVDGRIGEQREQSSIQMQTAESSWCGILKVGCWYNNCEDHEEKVLRLPFHPGIAILSIYPNKLKTYVHTKPPYVDVYSRFISSLPELGSTQDVLQ